MNRQTTLLSLLLVASAAAGYDRPVTERIRIISNLHVPMRDGVKL